jgi:hypothetical protein
VPTLRTLVWPLILGGILPAQSARSSAGIRADGSFYWFSDAQVLTAPDNADIVITGVTLSVTAERYQCFAQFPVTLTTEDKTLWEFSVSTPNMNRYRWRSTQPDTGEIDGDPGPRVPAGSTVKISAETGDLTYDCDMGPPDHLRVNYSIAGYYVGL